MLNLNVDYGFSSSFPSSFWLDFVHFWQPLTDSYGVSTVFVDLTARNSSQYFLGSPSSRFNWDGNEYEWIHPFSIKRYWNHVWIEKDQPNASKTTTATTLHHHRLHIFILIAITHAYHHHHLLFFVIVSSFLFFSHCPTAFWEQWKRIPFQA